MADKTQIDIHNRYAPFWAIALLILVITGLSTVWLKVGGFWNAYVLDMVGPAWTYILFRGLFTVKADNKWTRFFTPVTTFLILFSISVGIEVLQYFEIYQATFDLWDIVAYFSILAPIFLVDLFLSKKVKYT